MKDLFQSIDDRLLRSRPMLWIVGVHFFVPIIAAVALILFLMGFGYDLEPTELLSGDSMNFFFTITLLTALLSILLLIMFIIRQVRFNQTRVHISLPYNRGVLFFLMYFLIIGAISALPFMAQLGAYAHALGETSAAREALSQADGALGEISYWDVEAMRSLLEENQLHGHSIEDFQYADMVEEKSGIFHFAKLVFWKHYLLVALGFAMMLYVLCASELRDFGWAMLISALFPVVLAILVALNGLLLSFDGDMENSYIGIMSILMLTAGLFAFMKGVVRPGTSRSYAIMFCLFTPYFAFSYFAYINDNLAHDLLVPLVYGSSFLAILFFNGHFKRRYIDPI